MAKKTTTRSTSSIRTAMRRATWEAAVQDLRDGRRLRAQTFTDRSKVVGVFSPEQGLGDADDYYDDESW